MTYRAARAIASSRPTIDGIGFVLSEDDPFVCWDFDDVIDEHGFVKQWAVRAIIRLDSYTEYSPSQTGFHTLTAGEKPGSATKGPQDGGSKVEVFDTTFITVTGEHLAGTPTTVKDRQEAIDGVYGDLVGNDAPKPKQADANIDLDTEGTILSADIR